MIKFNDPEFAAIEALPTFKSSTGKGYVSRKPGGAYALEYKGRYGSGWTVHKPHSHSTRWHYMDYKITPAKP